MNAVAFVLVDRNGRPVLRRLDPARVLSYSSRELAARALPYVAADRGVSLRVTEAR
ncbi:MAG: hypothetical protein AB7T06_24680 [Kofleriaceae bacterium]